MVRSKVVQALADLASSGRYTVDPAGARNITALYEVVAQLINELEAEEVNEVAALADVKTEGTKSEEAYRENTNE